MGTLAAALKYSGTIFLCFGITFAIIELLGARYGTPHDTGVVLAIGLLVAGGVFVVASRFMTRGNATAGGR
jgi:hypothetical protein